MTLWLLLRRRRRRQTHLSGAPFHQATSSLMGFHYHQKAALPSSKVCPIKLFPNSLERPRTCIRRATRYTQQWGGLNAQQDAAGVRAPLLLLATHSGSPRPHLRNHFSGFSSAKAKRITGQSQGQRRRRMSQRRPCRPPLSPEQMSVSPTRSRRIPLRGGRGCCTMFPSVTRMRSKTPRGMCFLMPRQLACSCWNYHVTTLVTQIEPLEAWYHKLRSRKCDLHTRYGC